ncbi:lytic murein transglycosylase [Micromonospora mangrovi]|uniref:Lytic murein transglycosylase n=2 Tax=Micromonospora TaxID=1873 RepID=A0AAU7MH18_9ACTN
MVDGEESVTLRPLRPAAPPDGTGPAAEPAVPRPRSRSGRRATPSPGSTAAPAATDPKTDADAKSDAWSEADPKPGVSPKAGTGAKATTGPRTETDPKTGTGPKADAGPEAGTGPKTATDGRTGTGGGGGTAAGAVGGRRRRLPYAHALRVPPRQLAVTATRATRDWSRRPGGRVAVSGLFLLLLVAGTATAGVLLVPRAAPPPEPVAVDVTATVAVSGVPEGGALPGTTGTALPPPGAALPGGTFPPATALPGGGRPTGPVVGPAPTGRPADALAGWAQQMSARTGIPPVAMQAYGYAELVLAQTHRSCQLSWTTLAAIGYVESRHGTANGATLTPGGRAEPEIIGDPLDGQGGRSRILDTDKGKLDRDTTYDRAIGPMQFIPSTWQQIGADADSDGRSDPHDIDDAALAAGDYLCAGGRNMTISGDWWGAILSYNDVRRYAQAVFDKANEYGRVSRT